MEPEDNKKRPVELLRKDEKRILQTYGKLPRGALLGEQSKERKYFDSGDFAVSAAGNLKTSNGAVKVGAAHPQRGSISPVPKYSNVNEDANEYLHDKKSDNLTQYSSPLHQQGDQNENISNRQT